MPMRPCCVHADGEQPEAPSAEAHYVSVSNSTVHVPSAVNIPVSTELFSLCGNLQKYSQDELSSLSR